MIHERMAGTRFARIALAICLSLFGGAACGKLCDLWSFESHCEGDVAPQCLGDRLLPRTVHRIDCAKTGDVCANPEWGENMLQAPCYLPIGSCDAATFAASCDPTSGTHTRCVRGRIIGEGTQCTPDELLALPRTTF
jgi:hypothetical protein